MIAEARANQEILEQLEQQGRANALAIAELKGMIVASAPESESGPAPEPMQGG